MSSLTISRLDGTPVVDSRLIAEELQIQHKNLLDTLNRYLEQIEGSFGVVAFETEKPLKGTRGGRPEQFAYLTEDQATLLMTFSRNTARVVSCKVKLVKAFSDAKRVIKAGVPPQVQSNPAQLTPQEAIDFINQARDLLSELCGGLEERDRIMLSDVTRNAVLRVQGAQPLLPAAEEITISDRVARLGYRLVRGQLMNIGKLASRLYQEKHGKKPLERTQYVDGAPRKVKSYCSGDLDIVDAAIQRVMGEQN